MHSVHEVSIIYCCLVPKSCLTLCDPMNCSPPGSSVHGISQARKLELECPNPHRVQKGHAGGTSPPLARPRPPPRF